MSELTIEDLGSDAVSTAVLHTEHLTLLAATLGRSRLTAGDPLPLGWHWAFFNPTTPSSQLGPDGHPARDPDGPTGAFPRRMFASGRIAQIEPLRAGDTVQRHSEVTGVRRTSGTTGELMIVTITHRLSVGGAERLTDTQTLVYRQAGDRVPAPVGDHVADAPAGGWAETRCWSPVDLFRFSAVTFNSHRIHYDHAYATGEEGYPGLVVHGPLTALTLAHSAADHLGRPLRSLEFRASAPLFVDLPHTIVGEPADGGATVSAIRNDGAVAMTATAS